MSLYVCTATPVGRAWHVEVPAVARSTQALRFADIENVVRDLVTIMTGEQDPEVDVRVSLPAEIQSCLDEAARQRALEVQARRAASAQYRQAAVALRSMGLTLADVGAVLGISHQRAAQLTRPADLESEEPSARL